MSRLGSASRIELACLQRWHSRQAPLVNDHPILAQPSQPFDWCASSPAPLQVRQAPFLLALVLMPSLSLISFRSRTRWTPSAYCNLSGPVAVIVEMAPFVHASSYCSLASFKRLEPSPSPLFCLAKRALAPNSCTSFYHKPPLPLPPSTLLLCRGT